MAASGFIFYYLSAPEIDVRLDHEYDICFIPAHLTQNLHFLTQVGEPNGENLIVDGDWSLKASSAESVLAPSSSFDGLIC